MNYHSINDLVELCHKNNAQIWQVIMMDNAHERMVSEDKIFENMRLMYKAMKTADNNCVEILYLIFDYPHKHYTFKYFEV